jgi:hypothetical protein
VGYGSEKKRQYRRQWMEARRDAWIRRMARASIVDRGKISKLTLRTAQQRNDTWAGYGHTPPQSEPGLISSFSLQMRIQAIPLLDFLVNWAKDNNLQ